MSPVQKFLVLFSFSLGSLSVCLFRIVEIKWSPSDEFGADSASISTLHTVQTRTVDLDNLSGESSTSIPRRFYETLPHKSGDQ